MKNCTWLEKDSDAEAPYPSPYKDYRVKIEVETKEKALEKDSDKDFIFPETASEKNFLYVKNAAGQWERVPVQDILSRELDESGAVLQYTVLFIPRSADQTAGSAQKISLNWK